MGIQNRTLFLIGLMCMALAARFLPHPPNFSPLAAIALFGGASFLDRRMAVLLPMLIMFVSDLFLGLHSTMPFVYACLLFNAWLGTCIGNRMRIPQLIGASLLGSIVFFVVTNFGFWLQYQPWSWSSLATSYVQAIPFFQYTVAGDLLFSAGLFGMLAAAQALFPALQPTPQDAAEPAVA